MFITAKLKKSFGVILIITILLIVIIFIQPITTNCQTDLVIHEWGTFTSLQDENGETLGHINTDDEPVPDFVHVLEAAAGIANRAISKVAVSDLTPAFHAERLIPMAHPNVTMRLETPVMYFYPDSTTDLTLDVNVQFRGGLLNEFYPLADAGPPGLDYITPETLGTLSWPKLSIGDYSVKKFAPQTAARVWLAPREVNSAPVRSQSGEVEKYLFYRGVGNLKSPIKVKRSVDGASLVITSQLEKDFPITSPSKISDLWLVDIREDGSAAYRPIPSFTLSNDLTNSFKVSANFDESQYSANGTEKLRKDMHKALMLDGLYADEAQAMLNTWEVSYFKSPGLRIFFIVPKNWTDYYLPLKISRDARIERVMVGRIELVTPKQHELIDSIAKSPVPDMQNFIQKVKEVAAKKGLTEAIFKGVLPLSSLEIEIPYTYASYLRLGRFRQAILLNELKLRKSESLEKFIRLNKLEGYEPVL